MTDSTQIKGDVTELLCITELKKMGFAVSIPYGSHERYDFIIDDGVHLIKAQCKTSRYGDINKECFIFSTQSTRLNSNSKVRQKYTKQQIDVFVTYINNNIYIIPVEECTGPSKTIRFNPPKNNHKKFENCASKYLAENYFKILPSQCYVTPEDFIQQQNYEHHYCIKCGLEVSGPDRMCAECANKTYNSSSKPDRETLKKLIRGNTFSEIGQQYGVSDTMVHKWCKKYGLPYRKKDIRNCNDAEWFSL